MGHTWVIHGSYIGYIIYMAHVWVMWAIHRSYIGHTWVIVGQVGYVGVIHGSCMGHVGNT